MKLLGQRKGDSFKGVAGNGFIAFKGVVPTPGQPFQASEGVASGQQVIYSEETSFQALQKLPERAGGCGRWGPRGAWAEKRGSEGLMLREQGSS